MDQLRTALAWLKAQHFWVLVALAPLLATIFWYLASGALAAEFSKNKSAIESEISSTNGINGLAFKANDLVNSAQKDEIKKLADGVKSLWQSLYDRQKEKVLRWPDQLSDRFKNDVARRKFGDSIRDELREEYFNYIDGRFSELVKIVKADEIAAEGATGGGGGMLEGMMGGGRGGGGEFSGMGGGMPAMGGLEEKEFPPGVIVDWVPEDQGRIKAELQPLQRPTALKIWVTQENLWVYETILRAIADTNDSAGADRNGNAAVRAIYQMVVGKNPQASSGMESRLILPEADASRGGGEFAEGGDMGMGEMPPMEGDMGRGMGDMGDGMGGGEGDETQLLLAGRYLDKEGKPMAVAGGADPAADPAALDPAAAGGAVSFDFGVEYKRLPVSLMLQVDQRWLSRLIVEFANAPLQIEITEVRVNPQSGTEGMGGGGGGRGVMEFMGAGGGATEVQFFDRQPHVKIVMLQGIVYIFNPPDETRLAAESEEAAADPGF